MAKKAKKKKSASRAKKRPASKPNTSMRKTKKAAKKSYRAAHARAGLVYKKAKKKAPRRPNPTRALQSKIAGMKPGVFYDTTLSGAHVRMKRVGQQLVIRPKAKRK